MWHHSPDEAFGEHHRAVPGKSYSTTNEGRGLTREPGTWIARTNGSEGRVGRVNDRGIKGGRLLWRGLSIAKI